MAAFLIRFDDKHIFATQLAMADNRVLEGFIHNMGKPVILEIRATYKRLESYMRLICPRAANLI
ncbi:hypothetical protein J1N35_035323 [Gossypium stocksii]|uniref:Uncharacterized protein n=1 Tax=Gossypium stocksii TaxID=47602 RepID=A0A9D3UTP7_9ROSI|nr:hypothetical protein J1N35_035323 [Gossypium stocksii]